jgi:DNA uptake protein ComE-like DNA-binding protein
VAPSAKKAARSAEDWLLEPADRPSEDTGRETDPQDFVLDEAESQPPREPIRGEAAQWLVEPHGGRNGVSTKEPEPPAPGPDPAEAVAEPRSGVSSEELREARRALAEERERNADLTRRISDLQAQLRTQAEEAEETLVRTVKEQEAEFAAALRERDDALRERETDLKEQLSDRYEKRKVELSKDFDERQAKLTDQLAALEMRLDVREDELREQASRREAKLEDRIRELQEQLADAKLGTNEAASQKKSRRRGVGKSGGPDVNEVSFEQLRELGLSVTQSARVIAYRETRGGFDSLDELDEIPGLPKDTRDTLKGLLSI